MATRGTGADCFLKGSGCRTETGQECATRRPPPSSEVRTGRVRVCGGCYLRLRKWHDLEMIAAVRGEAQAATLHVSRKRPTPGDAAEPEAGGDPQIGAPKEAAAFKGSTHGVTRVYGEGGL